MGNSKRTGGSFVSIVTARYEYCEHLGFLEQRSTQLN
jgi:hypothetical protein